MIRSTLFILPVFFLAPLSARTTLWRIGVVDHSSGEFTGRAMPDRVDIDPGWRAAREWSDWAAVSSGRPPRGETWRTEIRYHLPQLPAGGAEFGLKTVEADGMVPELAVFSNGQLMGILQLVGAETPNQSNPRTFGQTCRVTIPRIFLRQGENTLTLEKLPSIYKRDTDNRIYLRVELDAMWLDALDAPPPEPLHSRPVYLGVVYGSFKVDDARVDTVGDLWEWLGIAYSGNPIRASFWSNLPDQPLTRELLETARDYRMSPVLTYLTDKNSADKPGDWIDADGELLPQLRAKLEAMWARWGDLVQYYEVSNEPCMSITHAAFDVTLALARAARETRPEHVRILEPGWAFGGGHGAPKDWSADPEYRRRIGEYAEAIGGHSYGRSYFKEKRGMLAETIDAWGEGDPPRVTDGFPREVIVTETGSHLSSHEDFDNLSLGKSRHGRLRASIYDKVLRAHVGFADRILQFSVFGEQDGPFRMLDGRRGDPSTWRAAPFPSGTGKFPKPEVDTKLGAFRRLALAYATHGAPLPYLYENAEDLEGELVYFRAVDTSTLPPLPGSGATADKVLLNFVNFSGGEQTLRVTTRLPRAGTWPAVRFGPEPGFADARSEREVSADTRIVTLEETLPPFGAVQWILTPPPPPEADAAPSELEAE